MADDEAGALTACVRGFARAVDEAEAGGDRPDAETLRSAEDVVEARLAMYRCLESLGWQPPLAVVRRMREDSKLLRQPSHEGRLKRDQP